MALVRIFLCRLWHEQGKPRVHRLPNTANGHRCCSQTRRRFVTLPSRADQQRGCTAFLPQARIRDQRHSGALLPSRRADVGPYSLASSFIIKQIRLGHVQSLLTCCNFESFTAPSFSLRPTQLWLEEKVARYCHLSPPPDRVCWSRLDRDEADSRGGNLGGIEPAGQHRRHAVRRDVPNAWGSRRRGRRSGRRLGRASRRARA